MNKSQTRQRLSTTIQRDGGAQTSKVSKNVLPRQLAISATSLTRYISQFLGTSKGRDKFMSLFQYTFDFYYSCAKYSNIQQVLVDFQQNNIKSILVAESFKEVKHYQIIKLNQSISQARKIYRILRFLDDVKGMQRLYHQNKPFLFKLLSYVGLFSSFMYYVSDNLLWIVGQLVTNNVVSIQMEHNWKNKKNTFSQLRVIVNIIRLSAILLMRDMYIYRFQMVLIRKERKVQFELAQFDNKSYTEQGNASFYKAQSLLKLRRKRRFEVLDLLLSLLRFCMLTKSLKMTGYEYLNPLFVSTCGLFSSLIAFFKTVYEKQIFIQLDTQNNTKSFQSHQSSMTHTQKGSLNKANRLASQVNLQQ